MKIRLFKKEYSESVIRKTLYWFSRYCNWTLDEDSSCWFVGFEDDNSIYLQSQFQRLLNDQVLREKLDSSTLTTRRSIIRKALKDIDEVMGE